MKFTTTQVLMALVAGIILCKVIKKEGMSCGSVPKEGYKSPCCGRM